MEVITKQIETNQVLRKMIHQFVLDEDYNVPDSKRDVQRIVVSEGKVKKSIVSTFHAEIDVRGMIGDDAWFVVDKYLDDAVLAGVPSVRIIHGKGTGALRAALWKCFKSDPRIQSFRHGSYGEGDAGVTIIEFKR